MTTPTTTWTRLNRRRGPDRNPLRRRADVLEAWLAPAAVVAFLLLGPVLAAVVSFWVQSGNAAVRQQSRSWHQVRAVLTQAAPGPLRPIHGDDSWLVWTPARWTAAGRARQAPVPAAAGTPAGAAVPAWMDRAGDVRAPPLTPGQTRDAVAAAGLIAAALLAVVLACLARLVRLALDRRRLAAWETAWQAVGPQWRPPQLR